MRVLFWTREFWPGIGGVEVLAAKFVPELCRRGYEVVVVTPGDRIEESHYQGIPVYRFPFRNYEHYASIERLAELRNRVAKIKRDFRPDLVHVNSLDVGDFFHITTSQVSPCPYLVTLHGEWPTYGDDKNSLVEKTLKGASWVAACSQATLDFARRLVPEISAVSSVIYNGGETPVLPVQLLPVNPPIVLCLGRLIKEKGFDVALTAFAGVVTRFPAARMVIAGDGPVRPELEQQAAELKLRSVVQFIGSVEPEVVPEVVNSATLVVVPSRWEEPFGLVALEAALMGRPVVATRGGGLPEVVLDGVTGILVEKENSRATADAILELLRHPETAHRMGCEARTRAIRLFGWDRFVNGYDELYRSLTTREKTKLRGATESPRL
jgi:glycogen synthase